MEQKNDCLLAVIIPMYNEEKGAQKCVDTVIDTIKNLSTPTSLIVVNDGSKDSTKSILDTLQKKYSSHLLVVHHPINKGYGAALQTGIETAIKENYIYGLFMDSDLTNDPKYIAEFAKKIPEGYGCVKASRYIKGGGMKGVPMYRQLISRVGNRIAGFLFKVPLHDLTNGFRMVKLELLRDIKFQENSFSIILEELYYLKRNHATFDEIPNILTARTNTKSSFRYTRSMFWNYLKYPLRALFLK